MADVVTETDEPSWPASLVWRCAGCDEVHRVNVGPLGWRWNGSLTAPTLTPSIRVRGRIICHSYVTDGVVRFLADSGHDLAGQSVAMRPEEADPFG